MLAFVLVAYLALPWILIFLGIHLGPNPPHPEITHGEFPFRLEYEINGERKVIRDTLICEFDGFGADEGRGKYRKWKTRLASGNERITLLEINQTQEIYYSPGSPNYYMGDLESNEEYRHGFPDALIIEQDGRFTSNRLIRADELLDKYHIKLISWEPSPPIKNTFIENKK
ncbi:hypothetical protein RJP21_01590 [Paenibacillus sp. VCA1]|uniref:hypothetical protein n=1 Tax=Paenibacillus sp. VCA1 TaxID=3039148 RepID=UPI002871169F|nr:hypothetical protein [Paenibacillus sp. VCA1]MDR9852289.1 hypothetical protein [Paenibacillus sp. VCA1]